MSAIHPSNPSKQWWSKVPTAKASTVAHRPPKITTDSATLRHAKSLTPTLTPSEETPGGRSRSNSAIKFNTLASVFRKKMHIPSNHADVAPAPISPPLPFQNPPSSPPPPRRTTKISTASINSSICGPLSPGEPSIFTLPSSSDDASEPITPSDNSRHRASYQPSFFTFAEPDKHASVASADSFGPRYFVPRMSRVSLRSDVSLNDVQSTKDSPPRQIPPPSRTLPASFRQSQNRHQKSDASHKRKSSGDVQSSFGFANHRSSIETKEKRFSDTSMPPLPKLGTVSNSRSIRKSPSALPSISSISANSTASTQMRPPLSAGGRRRTSREMALIDQAFTFDSDGESDILRDDMDIKDEIADAHDAFIDDTASILSQLRIPSVYVVKDQNKPTPPASKRNSKSERASVVLSLPSPTSVNSHPGSGSISPPLMSPGSLSTSTSSSSLSRNPSSARLRTVPPSRTPPPLSDLPPTPRSQPPSPLTFRSPKAVFSDSLADINASILAYDLPPSTPSSESDSSSASLYFAHPDMNIEASNSRLLSSKPLKERNIPQALAKHGKPASRENFARRSPLHSSKPSTTSSQAHTITASGRGETPTPRSLRKSLSQSSFSISVSLPHRERTRADSTTSSSSAQRSEESGNSSGVHYSVSSIGKALRKQRSLANTRAAANMLIPPLPPMLRHASSFNGAPEHVQCENDVSGISSTPPASSSFNICRSPKVASPSTMSAQRKRTLFRDRRDSSQTQIERDREEFRELHTKKSAQAPGLGISLNIFNTFGPNVQPSPPPERTAETKITPPRSRSPSQSSPSDIVSNSLVDQHILPPAELLSQMEALADMEEPSSPMLFSEKSLDFEEDEWSMDSSSVADQRSLHSTVDSIGGASVVFGQSDSESVHSSPVVRARQSSFSNMPSIHSRLQSDQRPSSSSKIPMRRASLIGTPQRRPSTAQTLQERPEGPTRRDTFGPSHADLVNTALPPPPRRPGKPVVTPLSESIVDDDDNSSTVHKSSLRGTVRTMRSQETIVSFNPNRGSIFRKPSFLNIDDDVPDIPADRLGGGSILDEVPEDSFLILERSKDSLDLRRSFDDPRIYV